MAFDWVGFAITASVSIVLGARTGYVLAHKAARLTQAGGWRKGVERYVGPLVTVWPLVFSAVSALGFVLLRWLSDGAQGVTEELLGLVFLRGEATGPGGLARSQICFYLPIALSISNRVSWHAFSKEIR